jgi:hypothetical protein
VGELPYHRELNIVASVCLANQSSRRLSSRLGLNGGQNAVALWARLDHVMFTNVELVGPVVELRVEHCHSGQPGLSST